MKKTAILFWLLILPLLIMAQTLSQTVIGSSGEVLKVADGRSLSFTLGEISVETYSENNKKLTQGFQQLFPVNMEEPPPQKMLTFYIDEMTTSPGQVVEVPVKVREFKNIAGFSFSMELSNSNLAEIQEVGAINLPNSDGFIASKIGDSFVCLWSLPGNVGLTLEDDYTIFTLRVLWHGKSDCTEIIFANVPVSKDALQRIDGNTTSIEAKFDKGKLCSNDDSYAIDGLIIDTEGIPLSDVKVQCLGLEDSTLTQTDGIFTFDGLQTGKVYTLSPTKIGLSKSKITLLDIQVIDSHVKGIDVLDSPYQIIAADVNQSNSVDMEDVLLLQQLLLGIIDEFPNSKGWRFVSADYEFADPKNPFAETIPEVIKIDGTTGNSENYDFIAIRLGDVIEEDGFQENAQSRTANLNSMQNTFQLLNEAVQLNQNYPNPFSNASTISWTLPKKMEAIISIYDVTGKTIKIYKEEYNAGFNQKELTDELFPKSGIYYYTLQTKGFYQVKKMIKINQ